MSNFVVKLAAKGALNLMIGAICVSYVLVGYAAPASASPAEFLNFFVRCFIEQGLVLALLLVLLVLLSFSGRGVPNRRQAGLPLDYGINPGSGVPMLNGVLDVTGKPYGNTEL